MKEDTVTKSGGHHCGVVDDPLTEVLRSGSLALAGPIDLGGSRGHFWRWWRTGSLKMTALVSS